MEVLQRVKEDKSKDNNFIEKASNEPKVSVIIPTYNRANYLANAIESAINQTYSNIEIIVSDDNSTDNTSSVVKSFDDNRIKYLVNQRNKGPSGARNSAILKSKGEFIAFLDDDDEWLPNKLECQLKVFDNGSEKLSGVYSNLICIDRISGKLVEEKIEARKLSGNLLNELGFCNPIKTTTLMLRKSCLDEVGLFDETLTYMEDRDLLIRISKKWDFEYISEPLVKYYYHDKGQLTGSVEGQIKGRETVFRRYYELFSLNKKRWSLQLLGLGVLYCQINQMKHGRKKILKSISNYPFNKMAYFHLVSSFLGPNFYQNLRKLYKLLSHK